MKIMIFTEGTATIHAAGNGIPREEAVRQVLQDEATVKQFDGYIPHGHAVEKLSRWKAQGAEIYYLTSRRNLQEIAMVHLVLQRHGFPNQDHLHWRREGETYQHIVAQVCPDLLIEDDCESIGGSPAMIYPNLPAQIKETVASIVVSEFSGIDLLPDLLGDLKETAMRGSGDAHNSVCRTLIDGE